MGSWPWRWSGPTAFVPRRGLLGWFVQPPEVTQLMVLHGWKLLTWNLWVVVGLVIYLALLVAAVVTWRQRPQGTVRAAAAAAAPAPSPIDVLLARADAILSGSRPLNGSGSGPAMAGKKAGGDAEPDAGALRADPAVAGDAAETTASRPAAAVPRPTRLFPLLASFCREALRIWSGGPPA